MKWTDIDDIVIDLDEAHPDIDPTTVRFTQLRQLVEALPEFEADEDHRVNEQILEAIQGGWIEERQDAGDDDNGPSWAIHNPFR